MLGQKSSSVAPTNKAIYCSVALDENFEKSVELFETLLAQVTPDEEALTNLKMDVMKKRADAKLNKQTILYRGMSNYAKYGPNPFTNRLSDDEIVNTTSDELITKIKDLTSYEYVFFNMALGLLKMLPPLLSRCTSSKTS